LEVAHEDLRKTICLGMRREPSPGRCIGCAGILGVGTPSYESMSPSGDGEECCLLATFSVPDLHASIYLGFEDQRFCRRLETAAPWPSAPWSSALWPSAFWHLSLALGSLVFGSLAFGFLASLLGLRLLGLRLSGLRLLGLWLSGLWLSGLWLSGLWLSGLWLLGLRLSGLRLLGLWLLGLRLSVLKPLDLFQNCKEIVRQWSFEGHRFFAYGVGQL